MDIHKGKTHKLSFQELQLSKICNLTAF